jgi:hypothetical protein
MTLRCLDCRHPFDWTALRIVHGRNCQRDRRDLHPKVQSPARGMIARLVLGKRPLQEPRP